MDGRDRPDFSVFDTGRVPVSYPTSLEVLSRGVLFPVLAGKDPYLKTPLERHWGWWSMCVGEDKLMVI